jgi:hypothetical protein
MAGPLAWTAAEDILPCGQLRRAACMESGSGMEESTAVGAMVSGTAAWSRGGEELATTTAGA